MDVLSSQLYLAAGSVPCAVQQWRAVAGPGSYREPYRGIPEALAHGVHWLEEHPDEPALSQYEVEESRNMLLVGEKLTMAAHGGSPRRIAGKRKRMRCVPAHNSAALLILRPM